MHELIGFYKDLLVETLVDRTSTNERVTQNIPTLINEGEGEKGPIFFIFPRKSIIHYSFLSLIVNDLIIIAK
jgi:hypothetical protein